MHIKRFEASTTAEAVRMVREELGENALVLSVRKFRKHNGLFGLFSKACVEVTASVDREVRRGSLESSSIKLPAAEVLRDRAAMAPIESELKLLRAELHSLRAERLDDEGGIRDEIEALRRLMLGRVGSLASDQSGRGAFTGLLGRSGLAMRHLEKIGKLGREIAADQGIPLDHAYRMALAKKIDERTLIPREDNVRRVALFIGAPGVGKTTTLAKIAAQEDVREDRVSLLTTDTFRIGAEDQLRTYADLLQVSFATAVSPASACERVEAWRNRRVLIDTAGRSRGDRSALAELVKLRELLGNSAMVHLVLSAETKESDLREQIRRFSPLHPDSVIVTKTDESDDLSEVTNVLLDETTPPLLWWGTGQRVPEDLKLPDPDELAAQLLEVAA